MYNNYWKQFQMSDKKHFLNNNWIELFLQGLGVQQHGRGIDWSGLDSTSCQGFLIYENIIIKALKVLIARSYFAANGYIRLLLLFGSLIAYNDPAVFLSAYAISALLDSVDGALARKLNQTSAFGAWFDVVIDLISRGALWCFLSRWGYIVMMIEWLTFTCTHSRGPSWKIPPEEFPTICKMVMAKGFKTPVGAYAITGIFVLPIWLYGMQSGFLDDYVGLHWTAQYAALLFLIAGRLLGLTTEIFYIYQHIKQLVADDVPNKQDPIITRLTTQPQ